MFLFKLLDYFLFFLHLLIIGFNLSGWIWKKTTRLHLLSIALVTVSWFGLGVFYGWGYCPLTDWEWQVKNELGETGLPNSFIRYLAEKIFQHSFSPDFISTITGIVFAIVALLSLYRNFWPDKDEKNKI